MKNLKVFLNGIFALALIVSFTQCEKDDKNDSSNNNSANDSLFINGIPYGYVAKEMTLENEHSDNTFYIKSKYTDGNSHFFIKLQPPSKEEWEGTYISPGEDFKLNGDTYYYICYDDCVFKGLIDGTVKLTNTGGDNYRYDVEMVFGLKGYEWDTISGHYNVFVTR